MGNMTPLVLIGYEDYVFAILRFCLSPLLFVTLNTCGRKICQPIRAIPAKRNAMFNGYGLGIKFSLTQIAAPTPILTLSFPLLYRIIPVRIHYSGASSICISEGFGAMLLVIKQLVNFNSRGVCFAVDLSVSQALITILRVVPCLSFQSLLSVLLIVPLVKLLELSRVLFAVCPHSRCKDRLVLSGVKLLTIHSFALPALTITNNLSPFLSESKTVKRKIARTSCAGFKFQWLYNLSSQDVSLRDRIAVWLGSFNGPIHCPGRLYFNTEADFA